MKNAAILLRDAGSLDAEIIAALYTKSFSEEAWDKAAISETLTMPGAFGLLAVDGDRPLGFILACITADEGEILALSVCRQSRRQGLGRRLLRAALARAASAEARTVHLEVAEDNAPARELYLTEGFHETGRRPAYYRRRRGAAADALSLRRHLL